MTAAPAWNKPGLTTDWAEDVEEEEAKQGKIEPTQKSKKRGKGISLAKFHSQGPTLPQDRKHAILQSLPTHASGIAPGDPGHYRSGGHHGGAARHDSFEPSKADQSDSWGADRAGPPMGLSRGGMNRGGPGGFAGGFSASGGRSDEEQWGRRSAGFQGGPPQGGRPDGDRMGFSGRADAEASWGRSCGQPPPPERFRGGPSRGFAGDAPSDEGNWARGAVTQRQPMPQRRPVDDAQWGRSGGQPLAQPPLLGARADEERRWSRTPSSQALKATGDERERPPLREVDLSDDWKADKGKAGSVRGAGSHPGSATGASDRPDETRPSNLTAADGAMSWRNDKPVSQPPAPAAAPQAAAETSAATHGRKEGRSYTASTWEKAPQQPPAPAPEPSQRARAENSTGGQSKGAEASKGSKAVDGEEHWGIGKKTFPERENARRNDGASGDKPHLGGGKPTGPPPPSKEEAELEEKVEQLRIRMEAEADVDADDMNAEGETMTVAQALESEENRLQQMKQTRLESASRPTDSGDKESDRWVRLPPPGPAQRQPPLEVLENAEVSAAVKEMDPDDTEGFQEVAPRSHHKKNTGRGGQGGRHSGRGRGRGRGGDGEHGGRGRGGSGQGEGGRGGANNSGRGEGGRSRGGSNSGNGRGEGGRGGGHGDSALNRSMSGRRSGRGGSAEGAKA